LVRPDQFVAWVSDEASIDPTLVQALFKRLRGNSSTEATTAQQVNLP